MYLPGYCYNVLQRTHGPTDMDGQRTRYVAFTAHRRCLRACRRPILDAMHCPCGYHQVGQVALAETVCRRIVVLRVGNQGHLVVWNDGAHCAGELGGKCECFLWLLECLTHVYDHTRGPKYGKFLARNVWFVLWLRRFAGPPRCWCTMMQHDGVLTNRAVFIPQLMHAEIW